MRRFSELSKQLALEYVGGPDDPFIAAVTADSRGVVPQGCFVAVRGRGVDGHGFCEEAIRRGAQVLIVEDESRCPPRNGFTVFKASDTREVLAELLRQWYGTPDQRLRLVAVTGTNGKTSVCHFVRDLLHRQ